MEGGHDAVGIYLPHYLYTSLTITLSVGIVYVCVLSLFSHAGDTCTVCCFLCPSCLPVLFFAVLAFLVYY